MLSHQKKKKTKEKKRISHQISPPRLTTKQGRETGAYRSGMSVAASFLFCNTLNINGFEV